MLTIVTTVAKAFAKVTSEIGKVTIAIGKTLWQFEPFHKILGKIGNAISTLGKRIKAVFVYSTISSFFNQLKASISSYISQNKALNAALSEAKGAWITAFMPILNYVIPKIIALVNWLTILGQKIALLTARIFGTSIKASQQQAQALEEQGAAAGGAAAAYKPLLAAFDELNRLEEPDGGGGGSGADLSEPTFDFDESEYKEYLTWYDWLYDKTQKLIEAHKKLDKWLQKCAESINWFTEHLLQMFRGDNQEMADAMTHQFEEMGRTLAEAINHFVDSVDWNQLGRALGAGLDRALSWLVSFIETMDWTSIGSAIAEALNGAISEINWANVGTVLVSGFNIVWELLLGFVSTLDWAQLGAALSQVISSALASINAVSFGQSINRIVLGLLQAFNSFLLTTDWGVFGENLYQKIYDACSQINWLKIAWEIIKAIVNGLIAAMVAMAGMLVQAVVTWVDKYIVSPFKKVLGIASPSKVFEGFGENIVQGLVDGISETWSKVTTFFDTNLEELKTKCSNAWESIKQTASQKWDNIKSKVVGSAQNTKTGVLGAFNSLGSGLNKPLGTIQSAFSKAWGSINTDTSSQFGGLITTIGGAVDSIGQLLNSMLSNLGLSIDTAWTSISGFVTKALQKLGLVNVPAMASGGVIKKPTLGLVGEYPGANSNPEIVTPESLLRSIVNEGNSDVADTLMQIGRQIIQAIEDNNTEIRIGDDVISASAARGDKDFKRRTGRSQFAY